MHTTETATTVRVRDGEALVTDGPFAETAEQLGGYFILDCRDLDEALSYAARCPMAAEGSVEVRPIMEVYSQLAQERGGVAVDELPDGLARVGDDRLSLLFTCCHPALSGEARVALTLQAVAGLTAAQIARAFLVSARADLLRRLDRHPEAVAAYRRARELATNPAEQRFLDSRLQALGG